MEIITGKTLISMGFKPAPWFGDVLREASERQLSRSQVAAVATARIEALDQAEADRLARELQLHKTPKPYVINITSENQDEANNVASVIETFDVLMRTPTLITGALMPDACPAGPLGTIPVGGVVAARNAIHPGMHSADICCSMTATIFNGGECARLLDAIHAVTHFGPGGRAPHDETPLPQDLREAFAENCFLKEPKLQAAARSHFTTCGDGNHFNFVGRSENTDKVVLVSHFGSRGPGAMLYKAGMKIALNFRDQISPETLDQNAWIPTETAEGKAYWEALQIMRSWTKQSHAALHDRANTYLGYEIDQRLWNEHNFCFREEDDEGSVIWHAKGATPIHNPLIPDTAGVQIVPLNMAQPILFVQGERHDGNLGFAPHGAGRNYSRTQHKKNLSGASDIEVFARETAGIDARFHSGHIDVSELPSAYKDADRVQAEMVRFNLCKVVDRIMPYGSIMSGDWQVNAAWRKTSVADAK